MPSSNTVLKLSLLAGALFSRDVLAIWPKRGLAWNEDIPIQNFGPDSQVNWQYNWDSTTSNKQSWAEYVPMLWGTQSYHTTQWSANANYWLTQGGSGHLLSFNEPDRPDQANLTPQEAADAYRTYMHPFSGQAALGAPAVSNGGYDWLAEFLNTTCADCDIDFVPVHWYNPTNLFSDLQDWVNRICTLANGRQIWITEFQGTGSAADQSTFLEQAMTWLDNNDCVYRYAWFGVADPDTSLLSNGGPELSALGQEYAWTPYGG